MQEEISNLRSKICALEEHLRNKSTCLENDCQEQIDKKEREVLIILILVFFLLVATSRYHDNIILIN